MSRFCIVLILAFAGAAGLQAQTEEPPEGGWNGIVTDLQSVAADMAENQKQMEELKTKIGQLQNLGKDSAAEIARLQTLLDAHAARVKQLGDRYGKVLVIAQKLKKDVERATVLNWVFGGVAAAAVIVAVGEGVVLANR